jgi:hypothetical protein
MRRISLLPAVLLTVAGLTGCGSTARYVAKRGDTGVVAIPNNSNAWPTYNRRNAEELIRQHVGPDFEVLEEREVVTGTSVSNNQQVQREQLTNGRYLPIEKDTVTNTTSTRDTTEYQITYRRRSGPAVGGLIGSRGPGGLTPATGPESIVPAGGPVPGVESVVPAVGPAPTPPAGLGPVAPGPVAPPGFQSRLSVFEAGACTA